jgi:hypothetical protein
MAKIEITKSLVEEINKTFKKDSIIVLKKIKSLENNHKKGKLVGIVGGIVIKELKYKNFRFYFLADGFKLKFFNEEHLIDLLLKFVRMSNKKQQQKVINEIRNVLKNLENEEFY